MRTVSFFKCQKVRSLNLTWWSFPLILVSSPNIKLYFLHEWKLQTVTGGKVKLSSPVDLTSTFTWFYSCRPSYFGSRIFSSPDEKVERKHNDAYRVLCIWCRVVDCEDVK